MTYANCIRYPRYILHRFARLKYYHRHKVVYWAQTHHRCCSYGQKYNGSSDINLRYRCWEGYQKFL